MKFDCSRVVVRTMNDEECQLSKPSNGDIAGSASEYPLDLKTSPAARFGRSSSKASTMPQRSPFAIQELLGLSDSGANVNQHRSPTAAISAITPSYNAAAQRPIPTSCFSQHHQMSIAAVNASRMAYFNAHAAVAAAFLPHNMNPLVGATPGTPNPMLGLANHRDSSAAGKSNLVIRAYLMSLRKWESRAAIPA